MPDLFDKEKVREAFAKVKEMDKAKADARRQQKAVERQRKTPTPQAVPSEGKKTQ